MSSAQRDLLPLDESPEEMEAKAPVALREQVLQRLAAHRARRSQPAGGVITPIAKPSPEKSRSSRIAAAVAERYANSPSYRTFLAEQARAAIREAEAAAQVAALSAQAVADAQNQLLAELDQWALTPPNPQPAPERAETKLPSAAALAPEFRKSEDRRQIAKGGPEAPVAGLTVRLFEDPTRPPLAESIGSSARSVIYETMRESRAEIVDESELALDEEIAFRQSPVFEELGPPVEIPANLIEFPRQLVAARKARPRLAEGPLREDAETGSQSAQTAQLRIFEVETSQISTAPTVESVIPEWSSILLAAHPVTDPVETPEAPFQMEHKPQTAPLNLRLMSMIVDSCIVMASFLAFVSVFAFTFGKISAGPVTSPEINPQAALIGAVGVLVFLTLLYQLLFFTFGEATPGMRYARIGLCTLSDDNPSRYAMRRRIFATVLAVCPLGMGFLWAWLDEDGLGWHDRISRTYQRSY